MKKNTQTKYVQKLPKQYEIGDQYFSPEDCNCTYLILAKVPEIKWIKAYIVWPNHRCLKHFCECEKDPCSCGEPFLLTPIEQGKYNLIAKCKEPAFSVEYTFKGNPNNLQTVYREIMKYSPG